MAEFHHFPHPRIPGPRLDLLAALELATDRAIQDYTRALREEGGLLPRQWSQGGPLRLRPKHGAMAAVAWKGWVARVSWQC